MDKYNGDYTELIRIRKGECIKNIMKCYQKILYGKRLVVPTLSTRKDDEKILRTIINEIDKLIKEIL